MRFWLLVIASGFITFLTRASFLLLAPNVELSPVVKRALTYVAPASFAAIAVPSVLSGDGFANFGDDMPRLLAFSLATFVTWKWRSVPAGLLAGMVSLWLLLSLFG